MDKVPDLMDSFVQRMVGVSMFRMREAIKKESEFYSGDWEDWWAQPRFVAERLADRLGVAELCLREGKPYSEYRQLCREIISEVKEMKKEKE